MKLIATTIREAMKTPGFTLLYIGGVAFTIAFTIIYGIILYGQLGPVYPEYDRNSTYYIQYAKHVRPNRTAQISISQNFIDEYLRDNLKSVEKVTAVINFNSGSPMVQTNGNGPEFSVEMRHTEPSFFNFYRYDFIAGRPFSQNEFEAGQSVAAVSDKTARKLFASPDEAIGETISIDHVKYRITGVFREGSALCLDSYGEVFVPYPTGIQFSNAQPEWTDKYKGPLKAIIKVRPGKGDLLKKELHDICQRINSIDTTASKFMITDVPSHAEHILYGKQLSDDGGEHLVSATPSLLQLGKPILIGLIVILLIPALNISGLIGARMNRIRTDIGVRRCFGADRSRLMKMVLTENLILTLAGGMAGLVIAWLTAYIAGSRLLDLSPSGYDTGMGGYGPGATVVTDEMAFAPLIFLFTLTFCILLNLLSAWIPARAAIKRPITESLNSKL